MRLMDRFPSLGDLLLFPFPVVCPKLVRSSGRPLEDNKADTIDGILAADPSSEFIYWAFLALMAASFFSRRALAATSPASVSRQ